MHDTDLERRLYLHGQDAAQEGLILPMLWTSCVSRLVSSRSHGQSNLTCQTIRRWMSVYAEIQLLKVDPLCRIPGPDVAENKLYENGVLMLRHQALEDLYVNIAQRTFQREQAEELDVNTLASVSTSSIVDNYEKFSLQHTPQLTETVELIFTNVTREEIIEMLLNTESITNRFLSISHRQRIRAQQLEEARKDVSHHMAMVSDPAFTELFAPEYQAIFQILQESFIRKVNYDELDDNKLIMGLVQCLTNDQNYAAKDFQRGNLCCSDHEQKGAIITLIAAYFQRPEVGGRSDAHTMLCHKVLTGAANRSELYRFDSFMNNKFLFSFSTPRKQESTKPADSRDSRACSDDSHHGHTPVASHSSLASSQHPEQSLPPPNITLAGSPHQAPLSQEVSSPHHPGPAQHDHHHYHDQRALEYHQTQPASLRQAPPPPPALAPPPPPNLAPPYYADSQYYPRHQRHRHARGGRHPRHRYEYW